MKDRPVYTLAQPVLTGSTIGFRSLADEQGNILFWDERTVAEHAAAEENTTDTGWWLVIMRMVSQIRDDVED